MRAVRSKLAKEESVPAYVIFSDATLKEMAEDKPITSSDLLNVGGVGEHKLERYGSYFLDAIIDFNPNTVAKSKGSTYKETLALLKQNVPVDQIAKSRGIELNTVYSHIAHLYLIGDVSSLSSYVTEEELVEIKEAILKTGSPKAMKPVFDELKEQVPYYKIRLALAILEKRGS